VISLKYRQLMEGLARAAVPMACCDWRGSFTSSPPSDGTPGPALQDCARSYRIGGLHFGARCLRQQLVGCPESHVFGSRMPEPARAALTLRLRNDALADPLTASVVISASTRLARSPDFWCAVQSPWPTTVEATAAISLHEGVAAGFCTKVTGGIQVAHVVRLTRMT
jgi:hypothetical protein